MRVIRVVWSACCFRGFRVGARWHVAGDFLFVFEALKRQILSVYTCQIPEARFADWWCIDAQGQVILYYVVLVRVLETSVGLTYYYIVFANSN